MLRRFTSRPLAIAMAGLLILGSSERARADLSVTLISGAFSDTRTAAGNLTVAFVPSLTAGSVTATGAAVGEDLLGPATMDLTSLAVDATGPGTATFIFSMDKISAPVGPGTISEELSAHFVTGSGSISGYTTYGTDGNVLYSSLPLVPSPTGMTGTVTTLNGSSSGVFTAGAPYTLTEVLTIHFSSAGRVSISTDSSAQFAAVPEPSSLTMAGLGALGVIGYGLRRRKALGA